MTDQGHVQYTILRQAKSTEPDLEGGFQDYWKVWFETPSGVVSYVTIPADYYSAANVDAAIRVEVAHIEQVQSLGETGAPHTTAPKPAVLAHPVTGRPLPPGKSPKHLPNRVS